MDKFSQNLVAWEIEGLSDGSKVNRAQFAKLLLKLDKNLIFSDDGSIRTNNGIKVSTPTRLSKENCAGADGNQFSYEIKSKPAPLFYALDLLNKIFNLIKEYGYVNSSCGLHLNISSLDNNISKNIDLLNFAVQPIWIRMGKTFKRNGNDTCYNSLTAIKGFRGKRRYSKLVRLGRDLWNKHRYVSFRHWNPNSNKGTSRVEIRIMGGADYHKKFYLIKKYTEQILDIFNQSASVRFVPEKAKF